MLTVCFYHKDNDDVALFHEHLEQLPRVGDFVSYSFEVHDKEKWDPEVYASNLAASKLVNHNWRVTKVLHMIRRVSIQSNVIQTVTVYIEPVDDTAR